MARKKSAPRHKLGLVDCTNAEYHGGPGESKSRLDAMAEGPLTYWHNYINPNREPRDVSPALTLGSATHGAILEPDLFGTDFVVLPEFNLRKPSERLARDQFVADHAKAGRTALTPDQHKLASDMRDRVYSHREASKLLGDMRRAGAKAEQTYYAICPVTGLLIKCRYDYLATEIERAVDLKTTRSAHPRMFSKSIEDYRYDVQEAWYKYVYSLATEGEMVRDWTFLAVDSAPPHPIGIYRLPEEVVRAALRVAKHNLEQIAECRLLDSWPDYAETSGIVELPLSKWHRKKLGVDSPENDFPEEL